MVLPLEMILLVELIMNFTDEEEIAYDYAVENEISLSDVPEWRLYWPGHMKKLRKWKYRMVLIWKMRIKGGHRYASWII